MEITESRGQQDAAAPPPPAAHLAARRSRLCSTSFRLVDSHFPLPLRSVAFLFFPFEACRHPVPSSDCTKGALLQQETRPPGALSPHRRPPRPSQPSVPCRAPLCVSLPPQTPAEVGCNPWHHAEHPRTPSFSLF